MVININDITTRIAKIICVKCIITSSLLMLRLRRSSTRLASRAPCKTATTLMIYVTRINEVYYKQGLFRPHRGEEG